MLAAACCRQPGAAATSFLFFCSALSRAGTRHALAVGRIGSFRRLTVWIAPADQLVEACENVL